MILNMASVQDTANSHTKQMVDYERVLPQITDHIVWGSLDPYGGYGVIYTNIGAKWPKVGSY